jgi:endonuclease/exonuclease/phosphatase family metal-dependent hydrolase
MMKRLITLLTVGLLFSTCEPLVEKFDEEMPCQYYQANQQTATPPVGNDLLVMTWNVRFGIGKAWWFGDSCGDRVILSADEVLPNLEKIAEWINTIRPDIVLLQEVDIDAKRSAYIDQMQYLLDHTYLNYGVYASNWKAQYIPSDGLGRMDEGNAILAPWPLDDATRFQLPLRNDLDDLTRYFYVRENVLQARVNIPGVDNLYAVCTHLAAFSTDDTKQRQMDEFVQRLQALDQAGKFFVAGGDLNLLPPNATKTDYCLEKACSDEHFHGPNDNPFHRDGANYGPEITWLNPLYEQFIPALPLDDYQANESLYFTNTQLDSTWDSTLDHLFSNQSWVLLSNNAHQEAFVSDHCPVTARWIIPK